MPPSARPRRVRHGGRRGRSVGLTAPPASPSARRPRAARLDPDTRRGLIADAAEHLLAEHDPFLLTFDEVAVAAGVSRALVHAYLGDRRGLIDAVQVRIVGRLDTWVGHGLARATSTPARLRAIVAGVLSFVEAEQEAWGVLGTSGGFDHPALHGVRARWTTALLLDGDIEEVQAQAAVSAVLGGAGSWINRGVDSTKVTNALTPLMTPPLG